jgi:hypothetical protein
MKEGDILTAEWGWEQTNVDFYQVVKASCDYITIRKIENIVVEYRGRDMAGKKIPRPGIFWSEHSIRRKVQRPEDPYIKINKYTRAELWDGKPVTFSEYA